MHSAQCTYSFFVLYTDGVRESSLKIYVNEASISKWKTQSNKRKTNEDAERFNRHKERVLNPADQNPIEDQDDCNVEQVCSI